MLVLSSHFLCMVSFNAQNNPRRKVLLLFPCYRKGTLKINNLLKVPSLGSRKARFTIQVCWLNSELGILTSISPSPPIVPLFPSLPTSCPESYLLPLHVPELLLSWQQGTCRYFLCCQAVERVSDSLDSEPTPFLFSSLVYSLCMVQGCIYSRIHSRALVFVDIFPFSREEKPSMYSRLNTQLNSKAFWLSH